MSETTPAGVSDLEAPSARERILSTAYRLFSQRGIRAVGVDELVACSGVANATFYRHFHSKDELALAFLQRREQVWTLGLLESEARRRGATPRGRLLAIFDVFEEWFEREDFEACTFINVLLEMGRGHPLGQASIDHLANIRDIVRTLAEEADLADAAEFARSWHILMKGAIISAAEGEPGPAARARRMAERLIDHHSGTTTPADRPRSGYRGATRPVS